jgi:general secretion pathway protein G
VMHTAKDAGSAMQRRFVRYGDGSGDAGYTLIELLVVLAILSLIVAFAAPKVIGYFERSKTQAAAIEISTLMSSLDLYRLDTGHYPSADQGLKALILKPEHGHNWHGPYLDRTDGIIDPWGRPFLYTPPRSGSSAVIMSYGADGKPGGADEDQDVTSVH